jgi:hypothetical protein
VALHCPGVAPPLMHWWGLTFERFQAGEEDFPPKICVEGEFGGLLYLAFGKSHRWGLLRSSFSGFGIVQIVEVLITLARAFYNLYLVDVDVGRFNMSGIAGGLYYQATAGLEAESFLDRSVVGIAHVFTPFLTSH